MRSSQGSMSRRIWNQAGAVQTPALHTLTESPWASDLHALSLSLPIYKGEVIITSQG